MSWSASKVFAAFLTDVMNKTTGFDLNADTLTCALYNNSITPDNTVALANTAYDAGQWDNTNEVASSGQWDAGGEDLASVTSSFSSTTYTLDAADLASGSTATLSNVYGGLVYDNTVTGNYGVCYAYFGGANSVTSGTFTIVWSASGVFSFSVA